MSDVFNCKATSKHSKAEGYNQVPAHHEPHRLGRLCGRNLDNRQLCASGLAHLPHPRCERHIAKHVQLVHSGRGALVGLRHLDGGLAHHHCQHYHHQFGVDDFTDEAALPLKIEFVPLNAELKNHGKTGRKKCSEGSICKESRNEILKTT